MWKSGRKLSGLSVDELRTVVREEVRDVVNELHGKPTGRSCANSPPQTAALLPGEGETSANGRQSTDELEELLAVDASVSDAVEPEEKKDSKSPPVSPRAPAATQPLLWLRRGARHTRQKTVQPSDPLGLWGPRRKAYYQGTLMQMLEKGTEKHASLVERVLTLMPHIHPCIITLLQGLEDCWKMRQPEPTGCLADLVRGAAFSTFFSMVIVIQVVYMVWASNAFISGGVTEAELRFMSVAEIVFLSAFCVELVCKLAIHRFFFFWNADLTWNCLDLFLVVQGVFDAVLSEKGHGKPWLRTLRIFRVARVLRLLRVIKMFRQLQVIMDCIIGSMLSLFWSMLVFALLFLMFALYLVQTVSAFEKENGVCAAGGSDQDSWCKEAYSWFGSVQQAMLGLFMMLTGGKNWGDAYDVLEPLGFPAGALILFIAFSTIALLNIVTGIFVEEALQSAQPDARTQAEKETVHVHVLAETLKGLLSDGEEDEVLSRSHFQTLVREGKLESYLNFLGVDPIWVKDNLDIMFEKLAAEHRKLSGRDCEEDHDVSVDLNYFVDRIMQLRGSARSTEIVVILDIVRDLQEQLDRVGTALGLEEQTDRVGQVMSHLPTRHGD